MAHCRRFSPRWITNIPSASLSKGNFNTSPPIAGNNARLHRLNNKGVKGRSMRQAFFWIVLLMSGGTAVDVLMQAGAANAGQADARKPSNLKDTSLAGAIQKAKVDFQDSQALSMIHAVGSKYRASFFARNDEDAE